MGDFISQSTLDAGFEPTPDALDHTAFADSVLDTTLRLPKGSIVAVQGPWGRGKTDVLTRVASLIQQRRIANDATKPATRPLWINPWQYGTPDLLTPLVLELVKRIPQRQRRSNRKAIRRAAESVVRAGASFGLKAAAVSLPAGQLLEVAAQPIDNLLKGLFDIFNIGESASPDPDPVAMMAARFCELVDQLLEQLGSEDARLVICVDDLDRCLPHRQVALLEALRFLGSSGAATTILVALDPTLARQAVVTHYGTDVFDPDLYLDKMFHLRITLPAMSPVAVKTLIRKELTTRFVAVSGDRNLGDWMTGQPSTDELKGIPPEWDWPATPPGSGWPAGFPLDATARHDVVADAISATLQVQDLRSPRLINRMIERIEVLAHRSLVLAPGESEAPLWMSTQRQLRLFTLWLALGERWPTIRAAMQAIGPRHLWGDRLREIFVNYWPPDELPDTHDDQSRRIAEALPAVVEQLPATGAAPGLRQCLLLSWKLYNDMLSITPDELTRHPVPGAFDSSLRCEGLAELWADFDEVLVDAGL